MKAKELLDAGNLGAAISELNQAVKSKPGDPSLRTFLFELLCFAGEYERAERQLDVIGHQDEETGIAVELYKNLITAESKRRKYYTAGLQPEFLMEAPAYVQNYVDANNRLREGQSAQAEALYEKANKARPPLTGRMGAKPFSSIRDYDDRLGPLLEVFTKSAYVLVPFEQITKLSIPQPKHLRDLLWTPATIEVISGPPGDIFIPVLYVGSEKNANDQIRLGRVTEWESRGQEIFQGIGQRTFLIDDEERGILELRDIEFDAISVSATS